MNSVLNLLVHVCYFVATNFAYLLNIKLGVELPGHKIFL